MDSVTDLSQPFGDAPMVVENPDSGIRGREQGAQLDHLTDRIERLTLASQALWELLQERVHLTEGELKQKMLEIDGRDNCLDGRLPSDAVNCRACGRLTVTKRSQCQFCGEPVEGRHLFRA
ncbi:MAG: hypothetical protein JWM59_3716 [Verrucomicrobiales bacterium]|nr:hypothetical protein [Verrucomicrobiales bacterium]